MFIQHKSLTCLNLPAEKIVHIHAASSSVQLAFSGHPPQLCSAFLLWASSGAKSLIIIGFYLVESECSIFFVPRKGEVPEAKAADLYEEGIFFVESMGFALTETDYHLMSLGKRKEYLKSLPICRSLRNGSATMKGESAGPQGEDSLRQEALKSKSLDSLGRFLAAM